jgi:hypothetical protein
MIDCDEAVHPVVDAMPAVPPKVIAGNCAAIPVVADVAIMTAAVIVAVAPHAVADDIWHVATAAICVAGVSPVADDRAAVTSAIRID